MPDLHSLPLYVQISEMLIREIQSGRLTNGVRLSPEREMAADLKISVGTLRKALALLEDKGLLERRQGSGNYIKVGSGRDGLYAFFRLELLGGGGLPTARLLSLDRMEKPTELPSFDQGKMAYRIRRLRLLNNEPAALEEIWLDSEAAPSLKAAELSESLYFYYKDRLNLWVQRVEDSIGIGSIPNWGAVYLPAASTVVGKVDRKSWDQENKMFETSQTWFDTDKVRYVSRL